MPDITSWEWLAGDDCVYLGGPTKGYGCDQVWRYTTPRGVPLLIRFVITRDYYNAQSEHRVYWWGPSGWALLAQVLPGAPIAESMHAYRDSDTWEPISRSLDLEAREKSVGTMRHRLMDNAEAILT